MSDISKILKDSSLGNFTNIMSREALIQQLLSFDTTIKSEGRGSKPGISNQSPENAEVIQAAADAFQSITTDCMSTEEFLTFIYSGKFNAKQIDYLSSFIKIVHAKDYKIKTNAKEIKDKEISLKDTPFVIKKVIKQDGPIVVKNGEELSKDEFYGLYNRTLLKEENYLKNNPIYTINEVVQGKLGDKNKDLIINQVDDNNHIKANKNNPSVSTILIDNPYIRIGTRNSIELSTFFNLISTVELSKCQPFIDVTFLVPNITDSPAVNNRAFKTASITHFLQGTKTESEENEIEKSLNASFIKQVGEKEISGTTLNMSSFMMPQTINNFDDIHVGHNENVLDLLKGVKSKRATAVHDITRPFMTIKNFVIDVAPTQGLMSFKTGKLSIVLHDRTRMRDIAPFVKPDMFGSFGSEIIVEYGWAHTDGLNSTNVGEENYLGQFLNNSKTTEKYIITNSSFSIDNNGQVNIDLSIAARGPIDVRTAAVKTNALAEMYIENLNSANIQLRSDLNKIELIDKSNNNIAPKIEVEGLINVITQDITKSFRSVQSINSFKVTETIIHNFNKFFNKLVTKLPHIKKFPRANTDQPENGFAIGYQDAFNTLFSFQLKSNGQVLSGKLITENFIDMINISYGDQIIDIAFKINQLNKYWNKIEAALKKYFKSIDTKFLKNRRETLKIANEAINNLIGGVDQVDPFYNKYWNDAFQRTVVSGNQANKPGNGYCYVPGIAPGFKAGDSTRYVSLGTFISSVVSTHLSNINKFDEIQIISYTANEYCGLMSNVNISSFLIPRNDLNNFLLELFTKGGEFTIESIISQVINEFIITRSCVSYGLAGSMGTKNPLYKRLEKGRVKTRHDKAEAQQNAVNLQLARIYAGLANRTLTSNALDNLITKIKTTKNKKDLKDNIVYNMLDDVRFLMPKIRMTFDALTSKTDRSSRGKVNSNDKKGRYEKTILRISLFDQNDSPFNSINAIMRQSESSEGGLFTLVAKLNKLRFNNQSKGDKINKEFYAKQWEIISEFIYNKSTNPNGILHETEEGSGVYVIKSPLGFGQFKNYFKSIMPSITYGTQNSAVLEASITTVNEAKLNTVYLARSLKETISKNKSVTFGGDFPLRVMPAQSSVTIYGCPFVNFAQYLFLDYETGTTIDNAYTITGIKHDLSPGKFTTSLTLSYGDVYGKYEGALNSINKAIKEATEAGATPALTSSTPAAAQQTQQAVSVQNVVTEEEKKAEAQAPPAPVEETPVEEPAAEEPAAEEPAAEESTAEEEKKEVAPAEKVPARVIKNAIKINNIKYNNKIKSDMNLGILEDENVKTFKLGVISYAGGVKNNKLYVTDKDLVGDPLTSNILGGQASAQKIEHVSLKPSNYNSNQSQLKKIDRLATGYPFNSLEKNYFNKIKENNLSEVSIPRSIFAGNFESSNLRKYLNNLKEEAGRSTGEGRRTVNPRRISYANEVLNFSKNRKNTNDDSDFYLGDSGTFPSSITIKEENKISCFVNLVIDSDLGNGKIEHNSEIILKSTEKHKSYFKREITKSNRDKWLYSIEDKTLHLVTLKCNKPTAESLNNKKINIPLDPFKKEGVTNKNQEIYLAALKQHIMLFIFKELKIKYTLLRKGRNKKFILVASNPFSFSIDSEFLQYKGARVTKFRKEITGFRNYDKLFITSYEEFETLINKISTLSDIILSHLNYELSVEFSLDNNSVIKASAEEISYEKTDFDAMYSDILLYIFSFFPTSFYSESDIKKALLDENNYDPEGDDLQGFTNTSWIESRPNNFIWEFLQKNVNDTKFKIEIYDEEKLDKFIKKVGANDAEQQVPWYSKLKQKEKDGSKKFIAVIVRSMNPQESIFIKNDKSKLRSFFKSIKKLLSYNKIKTQNIK